MLAEGRCHAVEIELPIVIGTIPPKTIGCGTNEVVTTENASSPTAAKKENVPHGPIKKGTLLGNHQLPQPSTDSKPFSMKVSRLLEFDFVVKDSFEENVVHLNTFIK